MKVVMWVIGLPVGILVLMMALGAVIKATEGPPKPLTEKEKFENAAAECWKEYERKSLTPMEKIGIAKFCEDLDARVR